MEKWQDPHLWIFLIVAMVWLYRARMAPSTLKKTPEIIPVNASQPSSEKVTVLIPAKNEEKNIRTCIERFREQTHTNLQILICNDNSSDRTEAILKEMGIPCLNESTNHQNETVAYFNNSPTEPGWTGKNFALHNLIPFAQGDWLLFTDADTRHEPLSVASSLAHAKERNLEFLTLIPKCLTGSLLEDILQPTAMAFLGLWFPMEKVNDPNSDTIFGNGQYIFIKKELYHLLGGHEKVKGCFLEDYALLEETKKQKASFESALGTEIYGTRMYDSFESFWRGWRRIYLHAFKQQASALLSKFFSLLLFSTLPFCWMAIQTKRAIEYPDYFGFSWGVGCFLLIFIIGTSWKAFSIVKAKRPLAIFHPIAAFFLAMILLDAFWMAKTNQKTTWR